MSLKLSVRLSPETRSPPKLLLLADISDGWMSLPAGLTLSENGLLSGRATTAGTYECEFTVATNWGTDTNTVKIVVNEV